MIASTLLGHGHDNGNTGGHMTEYVFHVIDKGEITMVVEGDFKDLADALNWAHFWLGFYRSDSVRVHKAEGETESAWGELITEITPPEWTRVARVRA
jgi:hypothetical protein